MEQPTDGPSWYRVSELSPRLRRHARIYRQHYEGKLTYILQDRNSGRYHMCSPAAHYMMSMMDGAHTVSELWQQARERFPNEDLGQADVTRLLAMLYKSDVLFGDAPADMSEQTQRGEEQARRKTLMRFINPLALRFPMFDPDQFLGSTMGALRFLFTPWAALAYLAFVGYALVLAGVHWQELTQDITDRVLAAENILITLLSYPLVKALHELAHGYAVKRWGGEVHEIGIMFLVFMPVPYVDASAAAAYPVKWQRALVAAAGILMELFLAAAALYVWLAVEDGFIQAFAFSVMLIGGVSTLLFNGNPLLRFDGYYVLQDILEIPNLGTRATRFIAYQVKHRMLGIADLESPASSAREARWLLFYGVASFIYRLFIMFAIVMFVASRFFMLGVILALWSAFLMLGLPLAKQLNFLLRSPVLKGRRGHAWLITGSAVSALLLILLVLPMPHSSVAEGVVWVPGEAAIHADSEGVVDEIHARRDQWVNADTPVLSLSDSFLDTEVDVLEARVRELELRRAERNLRDRVDARIVEEQLLQARADLSLAREYQANLLVRAGSTGRLIVPEAVDLPGRYVQRGDVLGYVANMESAIVRVVVGEDIIEQVRNQTSAVEIRSIERLAPAVKARILREVPSLSNSLPSMALSTEGGGKFILDPTQAQSGQVLDNVFSLELEPAEPWPVSHLGMRVYVKFSHGWEPLGWRAYRGLRRIFLRQLNV